MTDDIRPDWLNVVRRLQSVGYSQKGYALVSIQIMVDCDGTPVFWTEPQLLRFEPQVKAKEFLQQMISGLPRQGR
jgi:hypothetical protein